MGLELLDGVCTVSVFYLRLLNDGQRCSPG